MISGSSTGYSELSLTDDWDEWETVTVTAAWGGYASSIWYVSSVSFDTDLIPSSADGMTITTNYSWPATSGTRTLRIGLEGWENARARFLVWEGSESDELRFRSVLGGDDKNMVILKIVGFKQL